MIAEWLETRLTPADPLARRYGFVHHSVALRHRFRRCQRAWQSHLENARQVIEAAVLKAPAHEHLVVLGSAHLHEIPKSILEKSFRRVTLVDLVHPLGVRWWARRFPHIELVSMDLSGMLARLRDFTDPEELLRAVREAAPAFSFSADLVISSNLISQLHLVALEYLSRRKAEARADFNDRLGRTFSEKHLEALLGCDADILLYGDRETIYRAPDGQENYRGSFAVDMGSFHFLKKWTWHIAPLGEYSRKESIDMVVEAYELIRPKKPSPEALSLLKK